MKCYTYGKNDHFAQTCPEPAKVSFSTKTLESHVYSRAFVANSMEFDQCMVGSQTIALWNDSKGNFLGARTYQHKLRGGNTLLLHEALCVPGV